MTRHRVIIAIALGLIACSSVLVASPRTTHTFIGTYLCISCDLEKTAGLNAQCETFGHHHGIKLSNGRYIYLLENDHSADLIKGGGRENFPIQVTGYYDRFARTLDVQKYKIDGIESTWCQEHHRMDPCSSHKQLLHQEKGKEQLSTK